MVVVAQLVRASDCGSEGRGFEPHLPPKILLKVLSKKTTKVRQALQIQRFVGLLCCKYVRKERHLFFVVSPGKL